VDTQLIWESLLETAAPDEALRASDLFRAFPPEAEAELLAALEVIELPAGTVIFEQGDPGDSMYLVSKGRVGSLVQHEGDEQLVDIHRPGDSIGELALLTARPRTARCYALSSCELLRLSSSQFKRLTRRFPEALARFTVALLPRLRRAQITGALGGLFGKLTHQELIALLDELEWRSLPSETTLFHQGDPGDSLAIVVTGRLRVEIRGEDGAMRTVAELGRGEFIGELAVLTGEPRSATVVAVRDSDVVTLRKRAFEQLVLRHPQVMTRLTQVVVERLRRTTSGTAPALARRARTIALVPLSAAVPLQDLASQLAAILAEAGSTLHLDRERTTASFGQLNPTELPESHPANMALRGWLSEREAEHRFLLYAAEPQPTPWTLRCLRQADLVVLVAMAGASTAVTPIEETIARLGIRARQELLLVHPPALARPAGTSRWLARRQVAAHYHVRLGNPGDLRRVANLATGRGLGLALGGGGARGFAHIGVLRALEEAGIPVDALGGSSAGALIAAAAAAGMDWRTMDELARRLLRNWRVPDYTLPAVSLLQGAKLTRDLQAAFGQVQIEDLWHSYFSLSVNLNRLSVNVHRSGSLWRSVRASAALPLVFPPLLEGGEVLVDGGVMNNMPADLVRELLPAGQVIAVKVSNEKPILSTYSFGASVSGWDVLLAPLQRRERRVVAPSFFDILMRVLEINAVASSAKNSGFADLVIRPSVSQFGTLAFSAYDKIVEAGYRAAQEQLATWKPSL
jgi:predicted acylesterase/phospholipase RssA/CRP-like cAMP-binding protein